MQQRSGSFPLIHDDIQSLAGRIVQQADASSSSSNKGILRRMNQENLINMLPPINNPKNNSKNDMNNLESRDKEITSKVISIREKRADIARRLNELRVESSSHVDKKRDLERSLFMLQKKKINIILEKSCPKQFTHGSTPL